MANRPVRGEDIAIVGSGCRFPGHATSPSKLWDLVRNPRELAEPIPQDRFSGEGFYHPDGQYHGHFNVREGYFLAGEGVCRRFDAFFFGMNPAEAVCLDPQCRLLLETVYEALEAAGLTMEALRGSDTAVYAGQMVADYDQILMRDSDHSLGIYHASGTSHAILSNRVSYFFDWHGPSMTIDTACSSSLVAIHHAVQQLRTGQSRVAVAAGSNLILDPKCFISLASLNMLSPDGRCRMWDAEAKGYARGEGVGAVILKTVKAALEDGDDIECIIRETAFGQDGKTRGITSPNFAAQTALIRDCYSRAGLDLTNPADRPQFFECHGTGTLAGDAAEAQAITTAFFPTEEQYPPEDSDTASQKLWVGSIKSIVGHTEGTAGIAGILKASLALKHATVPPNLLFEHLNPRIEPFYKRVEVATKASAWPSPKKGQPRRASVNSFGFGGANVHAILESYEPATHGQSDPSETVFSPFVFSAASEASLRATLVLYQEYLRKNRDNTCLCDLAYTLHSRRSAFQTTTAITASDADGLISKIDDVLQEDQRSAKQPSIRRVRREKGDGNPGRPSVLGIFTGQGAQWAGMGSTLIEKSQTAREIVGKLEARLSRLPPADRPSWSLTEELLKDASSSRMSEATISQPLCTAVQILQIDLLRSAGVRLAAVVGHSSGEIGAAYASGFITAEDAICVAYYRGLHSHLAGNEGVPGSMMAVGTSVEDAQELCDDPVFEGRVSVAAINSPVSVTLSGDRDAIEELKVIFGDEKKFARVLKVDKAYHSHHMTPCSNAYLASLSALAMEIGLGQQQDSPIWFSSVFDGEDMTNRREALRGTYWNDNMVNPVLFQQAVASAYKSMGQFGLAVEIGPHSALQGPALQTLQDLSTDDLPYTSMFRRGVSAIDSVADCFGYIWSSFGRDTVDLQSYDSFVSGHLTNRVVKGLPTYAWDHGDFWNESRYAKAIRLRPGPLHELLGHMTPDSNEQDLRWRHILKPSEVPWLMGHKLQDQIVFPAAGYVATALEAAMAVCSYKRISASLIELFDIEFGRALVFDDSSSSVEVIVSMAGITHVEFGAVEAHFRYHGSDGKGDGALHLLSHGRVRITIGDAFNGVLPARRPTPPNLIKIPAEDFYSASRDLEYQWDGPFVGLDKLERKLGYATGCINVSEPSDFLIHPTVIDVAFQGILLGYSYPDDGQLWSIHVPGRVGHLSINPALCKAHAAKGPLPFVATHDPDILGMTGNTEVYTGDPSIENAMMQIEGMDCVPLSRATEQDDQEVFATIQWGLAEPDAEILSLDHELRSSKADDLVRHLERLTAFYMRAIQKEIPTDHAAWTEGPYTHVLRYVDSVMPSSGQTGGKSFISKGWENDTLDQLALVSERFSDAIEIKMLHGAATSILDSVKKTTDPVVGVDQQLLRRFYKDAHILSIYHGHLVEVMRQIAHRNPSANVLQIGAGTGAVTQTILDNMAAPFSYTITDVNVDHFESIKAMIPLHLHQTLFSTLDTRLDPTGQGFIEHSFDVVVVSLGLHVTPGLQDKLRNIRRLLKPGGNLIVVEMLPKISPAYRFIFGALPTWWDGAPDDNTAMRIMDLAEWDSMLRETGFSGCDTATAGSLDDDSGGDLALFTTQAMDRRTTFLQHPLSTASLDLFQPGSLAEDLIILGGNSLKTARLISDIKSLVTWHCGQVRVARTLPDLRHMDMTPATTVLSLAQLDSSVFSTLDEADWDSLRAMLMSTGVLLWVAQGRRSQNPYAAMTVGLMRSIVREVPTLSYRVLDFEDAGDMTAHSLAESLLRFRAECQFAKDEQLHTSVENEVVIAKGGRALIPRLVMSPDLNRRYNSHRRPITCHAHSRTENICVVPHPKLAEYQLIEGPLPTSGGDDSSMIHLEVTHSLLSAIRVDASSYLFPLCGRDPKSGGLCIALSDVHSSIATLPEDATIVVNVKPEDEGCMFSLVVLHIFASSVLRDLSAGDVILMYEPDERFGAIVAEEAGRRGIRCTIVTTSASPSPNSRGSDRITVHSSTPTSILSRLIPTDISVFVDLQTQERIQSTAERIVSLLPFHCRRETLGTLFAAAASYSSRSKRETRQRLQEAVERASVSLKGSGEKIATLPIFPPDSLPNSSHESSMFSIISWAGAEDVLVRIHPISTRIVFSSEKTYWLAGLSRGLGLSLCEWMIRHGAKYFVISSRNPQISPAWLQEISGLGAVVKVMSCDVTIKDQTVSIYREICETMPAIAGVCQGSMVLVDTAIRDMTVENFLSGTRPKVQGSLHLNDLFQENTLEFFIFFSSVVSTIGRPGQANYSAANMFMASLAEQRRQKGLAASVIHIGPIYGVGYAAQSERMIYSRAAFRSTGLVPTSERDFYQMFSEAVIAGRPGSSCYHNTEVLNGLHTIGPHDTDRPVWEFEPLMSHFVRNSSGASQVVSTGQSKVPVKTQLAQATNRDQVYSIIQEALVPKLYTIFQIDPLTVDKDALTAMRLVEIGIDSLLAVEIRGWFMKTIEVNIPVLKILSGVPIHDLILMAAETIPERLVPGLAGVQGEDTSKADVADPAAQEQIYSGSETETNPNETSDKDQSASSDTTSDYALVTAPKLPGPAFLKTLRLSFSQEMFWFIWVFLKDKSSLNHTAWARVSGSLDIPDLERAFKTVGQQHEILRTCIVEKDGKPMQSVMSTSNLRFEAMSIEKEEEVLTWVEYLQNQHVYDVAQGQTVRVMLLSKSTNEHFFVAGLHPLIADGISFQSLLKGVQHLYAAPGRSDKLAASHVLQYSDYSEKQHSDFAAGAMDADLRFWKDEFTQLSPPLPILTLSSLAARPDLVVYENIRARFKISMEKKSNLHTVCRRYRITPFHFYLAVFRALLLRYSPIGDGEDVAIGIGDGNRLEDDRVDVIGPFVNFLPLRLQTNSSAKFTDLVQHTRDKVYAALAHSKIPFRVLLDELGVSRSSSYTSLFQCFVNYRQGMRKSTVWHSSVGQKAALHAVEIGLPKMAYDVTLEMVDYADGECTQEIVMRKDMYSQAEVDRLAESYEQLIDAFIKDPTSQIGQPDMFKEEDIAGVMKFTRGPSWDSHWPETIIHRIDQVAHMEPQDIALWLGNSSTSYAELNNHTNAIASALSDASVAADTTVAVLMEPNPAFIASLLGVMRAGAVYLPLELSWPWPRLASVVADCQPSVVLVDEDSTQLVSNLQHPGLRVINVSRVGRNVEPTPIRASARSPAALLYTSGSSGAPKGIFVKHEGLRNWAELATKLYGIGTGENKEVILQQTTPTFDISMIQILAALCLSGSLCLIPRSQRGDAQAISQAIRSRGVTLTCATPSEYAAWFHFGGSELLRGSTAWRTAISIGESVPPSLMGQIELAGPQGLSFYNLYGPTEASLAATGMLVPSGQRSELIAAGKPLPNYSIYVVDEKLRPVPPGVQGEIYIGGAGVGLGYHNRPEQTARMFVPNVFATPGDKRLGWDVMHRTGDLGRWRSDGTLSIEGRIDTQVKIRGLRIDVSEVEHAIKEVSREKVREVIVTTRELPSDQSAVLVAHAVFADEADVALETSVIRSKLSDRLPQYMCPAIIIGMDQLPRTSAAKLDRKSLASRPLDLEAADLLGNETENQDQTALTRTEVKLREVWEQILGMRFKVVAATDFFHIGGSSMLLLKLQKRINETFGISMPLVSMFRASSLRSMADWIDRGAHDISENRAINWDEEVSLSDTLLRDLPKSPAELSQTSAAAGLTVVLTGATGQLGRGMLDRLLADNGIRHVHCIGVRNLQKRLKAGMAGLDNKANSVTFHEGDLVLPLLGMSEDEASSVFAEADVLVHNGADMSYLKTYTTLRAVNLQCTKNLAEMCARFGKQKHIPFHYISSVSVGNVATWASSPSTADAHDFVLHPVSVANHKPPPTILSSDISKTAYGYIATKWASEVFLERLHQRHPDWPVVIHRPSLISRDEGRGQTQSASSPPSSMEFVDNMGRYAALMNAVPATPFAKAGGRLSVSGAFDVVPLYKVVEGVTESLFQREEKGKGLRFLHHLGGFDLQLGDVRSWMPDRGEGKGGDERGEIQELQLGEWTRRAVELGMHPTMEALLNEMVSTEGRLVIPRTSLT